MLFTRRTKGDHGVLALLSLCQFSFLLGQAGASVTYPYTGMRDWPFSLLYSTFITYVLMGLRDVHSQLRQHDNTGCFTSPVTQSHPLSYLYTRICSPEPSLGRKRCVRRVFGLQCRPISAKEVLFEGDNVFSCYVFFGD